MCDGDKTCGPCAAKACEPARQDTRIEAPPLVVWGPISDEVPSRDTPPKLIRLKGIEEALPQLLRRGVVDVAHRSEFSVGKLHALAQVDPLRAPDSSRVMVQEMMTLHGGLPTGMVEVTPAIAACFPRIAHRVGERLPFAATEILGDNRTSRLAQDDVREGRLDSYSIAGALMGTKYANHCDPSGCQVVQDTPSVDLNSLTLTSYAGAATMAGETRAANPGAGFVVVQQSLAARHERLKDAGSGPRSVDEPPANAPAVASPVPAAAPEAPASDAPVVATPGLVAVPIIAAEAVAVAQTATDAASQPPPQDAAAPGRKDVDPAVVEQIVKRLTDLEVEVALLKGRKEQAPAPAPEAPAKEADAPKTDAKDKEAMKEAAPPSALKQTIPEPAPAAPAAGTPTPSAPGTPAIPEMRQDLQDLDNGDPSALRRIIRNFGGRKA